MWTRYSQLFNKCRCTATLLLCRALVHGAVTACTVLYGPCTLKFPHYVTVAACYKQGTCHYGNVAGNRVVPHNGYVAVVHCMETQHIAASLQGDVRDTHSDLKAAPLKSNSSNYLTKQFTISLPILATSAAAGCWPNTRKLVLYGTLKPHAWSCH